MRMRERAKESYNVFISLNRIENEKKKKEMQQHKNKRKFNQFVYERKIQLNRTEIEKKINKLKINVK